MDPLLKILREILKDCGPNFGEEEYAAAISEAAGESDPIDRKRIRWLLEKEERDREYLYFSEIRALHSFLVREKRGGFGALLGGRNLLESVAACRNVVFILPSKRVYDTTAVIIWDLRAMMDIIEALRAVNPAIHVEIEIQRLREPGEKDPQETWAETIKRESWNRHLERTDGPAIICIGSPRANHASEVLLAKMYDREPFSASAPSSSLPFRFYWKPPSNLPSSFVAQDEDFKKHITNWKAYESRKKFSALIIGGKAPAGFPLAYDEGTGYWESYGIIAAQRRQEGGQIWVVAAGLEGPASQGVAKKLIALKPLLIEDPVRPSKPRQYFLKFGVSKKGNGTNQEDSRDLVSDNPPQEIE